MTDLYLKFESAAQAEALLFEITHPDLTPRSKYRNTDVIGIIYQGGEWNSEGNLITPPVALDGWHVNIRAIPEEDVTLLLPYTVTPAHPRRVWA